MEVTQVSCRVVYADAEGSVHMGLPVYIDASGALHAAATENSINEEEVLSTIFDGASTTESDPATRKLMMERVVEHAMMVEDASDTDRAQKVRAIMKRLQTSASGRSLEEKDALRRAIIYERVLRRQKSASEVVTTSTTLCLLPAPPTPLLLPSVF
eukprot:TRINITY_DN6515_c0_g1_i2.p1 TRINITY_DN6515_c0_g1~~TRINITY_DN6515_c0_g1_i2.p1  ORF type:complete len:156 (-),score=6.96 TRINITY_DN6515_c0_g1_i2:336-803(-)